MPRKGSNPALYELIHARAARRAAPPPEAHIEEPPSAPPVSESPAWLSPGRTIRLPVGYLLLGAAGVIALLIVTYMLAFTRGEHTARADYERDWPAQSEAVLRGPPPQDPLANVSSTWPGASAPAEATGGRGASRRGAGRPAEGSGQWGPILSDPRRAGQNYFVLIHTKRDSAVKLAEFCREHGLEAHVVRANNMSLYRVIALPGYSRGQRDSEQVRALERRIAEVARKWKLQVNPRDDLLAYYPEKFQG